MQWEKMRNKEGGATGDEEREVEMAGSHGKDGCISCAYMLVGK